MPMPCPGLVQPAHFYHAYANAAWRVPAGEHLAAVSCVPGDRFLGVVGAPGRRAGLAREVGWPVAAEADTGWEQVTLRALHAWARSQPSARPVLYAHTKAATHDEAAYGHWWRRAMTHYCVAGWEACVAALANGYDAVGCHWLAPGFFAGNFWWATAGYLASLRPPGEGDRYEAEAWIGMGAPHALDLNPGPPEPAHWGVSWDFTRRCLVQKLPSLV